MIEHALTLGTWLGRKQAFAAIAGRCSAADAECLRTMREGKSYVALGMTWDECCKKNGVSRATADRIIRNLEEFGPKYFELTAVLPIPAEQYRQIAPAVTDRGVVCGGEVIEISAENSSRLAEAIDTLRGVAPERASKPARGSAPPMTRALRRARDSFLAGMKCYTRAFQLSKNPSDRDSIRREMESTRDAINRAIP